MKETEHFYTLKGYSLLEHREITASMEDYLEMICRMDMQQAVIRINQLSEHLNVKPSSASKMVSNLREKGLVHFERYGTVSLTKAGRQLGNYLLFRHDVLHRFFCYVNQSDNELELVEKIEHFIDEATVRNLHDLLDRRLP